MENSSEILHIEVVYALPEKQKIVALELPPGTTVREAVRQSRMDAHFPGLDLEGADVGIFGKVVARPEQQTLHDGERVEIYRPLIADPKEVRKQRAEKVKERQKREGRRK